MILVVCALSGLAFGQSQSSAAQIEHAPSVDQCRADQKLWSAEEDEYLAKMKTGNRSAANNTDLGRVAFEQLHERGEEMRNCASVDPQNAIAYMDVGNGFHSIRYDRLMGFLLRHKLSAQFIEEDKKGLR
jgi:hypothetical protein